MMYLKIEHISKSFDGLQILGDISFSVESGTIASLFGENGSGKTTIFQILSGFLKPDSGLIHHRNKNITSCSPKEISKLGIGQVWQTPRLFRNLSVFDNLMLSCKSHPGELIINYFLHPQSIISAEKYSIERVNSISKTINISGKLQEPAGSLSFGEQKLLSIGMLLMNEADLLLLDEPFAGINYQMVDRISDVLTDLKKSGRTILMIEHNRKKAASISENIFLIEKGEIVKV